VWGKLGRGDVNLQKNLRCWVARGGKRPFGSSKSWAKGRGEVPQGRHELGKLKKTERGGERRREGDLQPQKKNGLEILLYECDYEKQKSRKEGTGRWVNEPQGKEKWGNRSSGSLVKWNCIVAKKTTTVGGGRNSHNWCAQKTGSGHGKLPEKLEIAEVFDLWTVRGKLLPLSESLL